LAEILEKQLGLTCPETRKSRKMMPMIYDLWLPRCLGVFVELSLSGYL
jgi:hypothetical protein